MANLKSFKKAVGKAQQVVEAAAAAVAELTRQSDLNKEPTTFIFSAQGVNFGQLKTELLNTVSPKTQVVKEGDMIRVVTNNPTACVKALGGLGISAEPSGQVNTDISDRDMGSLVANPTDGVLV